MEETCNAEDALVKVLLNVCETALSDSLGGRRSDRRRSSFGPASSSHHGRQRKLRVSPFERKLKTSCTCVTTTSARSTRNSSRRRSPVSRISASWPNKCARRRKWQGLCRREAALHTPSSRARDRDSPRAQVGRLRKPGGNTWQQSSSLTLSNGKIFRDSCPRGAGWVSTGWTGRGDFPPRAKGQREVGTNTL